MVIVMVIFSSSYLSSILAAVHVTFLWPVIITEMVLVFSYIEQELTAETKQFRSVLTLLEYTCSVHCTVYMVL